MIQKGTSVVIFPEGGTSQDGAIRPFKGGGFMLATRSSAAVTPVTIRGSRAVLTPKTWYVRGGPVTVSVGKPISSEGVTAAELAKRVRDEIAAVFYSQSNNDAKAMDRSSRTLSRKD
jgi:1-acyl-sn-glycerol-3-phosphate acyltransferase